MNQIIKLTELFSAVLAREVGKLERDGIVSIHGDYNGKISIHVTQEYFAEHFSHYITKQVDWPAHGNVRVSFETDSGNEIFCLKACEYKRVS